MSQANTPDFHPALATLARPERTFASDNSAGAHPAAVQAFVDCNTGHALAYGADPWTQEAVGRFKAIFGEQTESLLVWGGTGANVMALTSLLQAGECVVCSDQAHIAVSETGAPERAMGAKLLLLPAPDGKIRPEQVAALRSMVGSQHSAQPGVLSITQCTEMGAVYSVDEVKALCIEAKKLGMRVHMDGARFANAVAAAGGTVADARAMTVDAGVDVLSFGGTKAGLAFGEAVVYLNPVYAKRAIYVRKQVNQLPSKMRFVAAQFNALLQDDLWIQLGQHSNAMAQRLYEATRQLPGVSYPLAPTSNGLFPVLPQAAIAPLAQWCMFWNWEPAIHQVRWLTGWDTTAQDIDRFAAGVAAVLGAIRQ